jgi:hypothetical protein
LTPEQQNQIFGMVFVPGQGRLVEPDDVLRAFGYSDGRALGLKLLRQSIDDRDADDMEASLVVVGSFGVTPEHFGMLIDLLAADWHQRHESVVYLLDRLRDPRAIASLARVATWIPDYLDWDENRALARNAIWAIGKIPGDESRAMLVELSQSQDDVVRQGAQEQLKRRSK